MWKILKQMNNKREYYYPVLAYTFLLVLVWLFSWIADMSAIFFGGPSVIKSLVSGEGLRWAARNAILSLNDVPWGTIMLVVVIVAILQGAGIVRVLCRVFTAKPLSKNEKRALLVSFLAFLFYIAILFLATVSPLNILSGVSGNFAGSPLMYGLPLFTFVGVLVLSLVYGFMYGNYRSSLDVVSSMGKTFSFFIPAFMALIPASGIVPCMEYTGVVGLWKNDNVSTQLVADIIYMIPFLYIVLLHLIGNGREE
jgi:p-aminobenzoyl-glutamate transporter AbgT